MFFKMALVPGREMFPVCLRNRFIRIELIVEPCVDMVGLKGDDGLERIYMRREAPVGAGDIVAKLNDGFDGSLLVRGNLRGSLPSSRLPWRIGWIGVEAPNAELRLHEAQYGIFD